MGKNVTPNMLGWGSYSSFEGGFWRGQYRLTLPEKPDFWDKALFVVTSTEGGCYDATNFYDTCICSVGALQLCDANYFLTTKLLGHVADLLGPEVITIPLSAALKSSNAAFKKFPSGEWRFEFLDERGVVNTKTLQRELYFQGTGLKNSWSPSSKQHSKIWICGLANIWHNEKARKIQYDYIKSRLPTFIVSQVRKELFDEKLQGIWIEVARAAYVSFSANIPLVASKMYKQHVTKTKEQMGSEEWTLELLRELTWGPSISIYPGRYDKIRPVLENLWNVVLPYNAQALKKNPIPSSPSLDLVVHAPVDVVTGIPVTHDISDPVVIVDDKVPTHVEESMSIVVAEQTSGTLSFLKKILEILCWLIGLRKSQ